jgi:acetyltransferase-like isoleucine patch superfamily enzyme
MKSFLKQFTSLYLLYQIIQNFWSLSKLRKRFPAAKFDSSVKVIHPELLKLGDNLELQHHVTLHCGGAEWCNNSGGIEIGDNSILSNDVVIWGCGSKVIIGKNFDCAPGVKIFSSRTDYLFISERKYIFDDVMIGDDVVIYANVIIGPGIKIGNGAVIGANSVVLGNIDSYTVAAGAPAKAIKKRLTENKQ